MTETLLFAVASVESVILVTIGVVVGAVGGYLFLRSNPQKKAKIDAEVEKISDELKDERR
jgi:hypothetical protein